MQQTSVATGSAMPSISNPCRRVRLHDRAGSVNFLESLAAELLRAADQLEQGNEYARAWAAHFRTDRGAVLLLAGTWREPSEPLTRGSSQP